MINFIQRRAYMIDKQQLTQQTLGFDFVPFKSLPPDGMDSYFKRETTLAFVIYGFFYKSNLYKKHQAEIRPQTKNTLRNKAG